MTVHQLADVVGMDAAYVEHRLGELDRLDAASADAQASIPIGLEKLAPLIALRDRLHRSYPTQERRLAWLVEKNPHFDGLSPIDVIRTGTENTQWLAYYLETRLNFEGDDA